jgi:FkbM family methyltransferase
MRICIIDSLGLCYDGETLSKCGLGGSESAVILISKELSKIGFDVTVINRCDDSSHSKAGVYDNVKYVDIESTVFENLSFDIVISSRSIKPFVMDKFKFIHTKNTPKILWLHDTFIEGDQQLETFVNQGIIDYIFTLSDWHTTYILNSTHGPKRNFEVLKPHIFQTRNGAVKYIDEVDLTKKDINQFVYNASVTKGLVSLLDHIWPEVKKKIPNAKLKVIGGYYRFSENAEPDLQEKVHAEYRKKEHLKSLDVEFTGILKQSEIAEILSKSGFMIYPGAFPETFGISTIESLLYNTPVITTRFGALEQIAIDKACYKIDYAIEPNSLFPHINKEHQVKRFIDMVMYAYHNPYILQQKQNYCNAIKDIVGWDTVALQWKQFFYSIRNKFLAVEDYRKVTKINDKVTRVFGTTKTGWQPIEYRCPPNEKEIIVISPVRNASAYVSNCILSVAQQDYENYKHIIIDDVSDDDTGLKINETIDLLSNNRRQKIQVIRQVERKYAIQNQIEVLNQIKNPHAIVILLDGDDWLINNNTIFNYYNDLYHDDYEFTYGSMWSLADNIPLIAQPYPNEVKKSKSYRDHKFNWGIPYTHLRTFKAIHGQNLNVKNYKDQNGNWMKAGADNPMFYEIISRVDPDKIYCNPEIVCNYNDLNPLNDYKINGEEQNKNANMRAETGITMNDISIDIIKKKILIAIPTNKNIETDTFKSIYDLEIPDGYVTEFQYFFGYQVDQIRNLMAEWGKHYDYMLCVDSDIVLPKDTLVKMLKANVDIISGVYIQRKPNETIVELYKSTSGGGCDNITLQELHSCNGSVVEVEACGFGCVLVKGEVFRKMEYPHFVYKTALTMRDTVSEDVYFCLKAKKTGFRIYADTSILCEHIGSTRFVVPTNSQFNPIKSEKERVLQKDLLSITHKEYLNKMDINPKVIYDIGSCLLHWSRHAKNNWSDSKIYAFDACDDYIDVYESNKHIITNYVIALLSDKDDQEKTFYYVKNNFGGNSYYKEKTTAFENCIHRKMLTYKLDTVIENMNWEKPDLIKIDVQGAELDVLIGATEVLKTCNDIIIELQHKEYNDGACKKDEVIEFLNNIGFKLVNVIERGEFDGDYHFRRV